MGKVYIDDVKVGMVLAEDVNNLQGLVLLRSGHEINEKNLRIFKMWGVTEVNVKDVDGEDTTSQSLTDLDPEVVEKAESHARQLFLHTDKEQSVIAELYRQCVLRLVRRLTEGEIIHE